MTEQTDTPEDRGQRDEPETLRLKSIAAGITVDDLEESLTWYCDVVGFHLEEKHEQDGQVVGASLVAGEQYLVISQDDWAKGRDRDKGQGIRLYLQASQDVDQVAAAISERGGTLETEPTDMPWGARCFDLVDPSGFKLTITS